MFDFRYHALSLAAVFIALVVGLLLGVAIGDKELVSSARSDLRSSLRADVRQADQERDEAKARLREQEQFADDAYPILTNDQLRGRRIGLVVLGNDDGAPDLIRRALQPTGADLSLVAVVRENVELERSPRARAARATRTSPRTRRCSTTSAGAPASRWCSAAGSCGELRTPLMQTLSGEFGGLDGVIVMRPAAKPKDKDTAKRLTALQDGIARGLVQTGVKVVGVERRASDPSHIGWYRDRELSSVDNIDEQAGRAAMVFVLAGAQGAYGRGDGAQALLPPVVGQVR